MQQTISIKRAQSIHFTKLRVPYPTIDLNVFRIILHPLVLAMFPTSFSTDMIDISTDGAHPHPSPFRRELYRIPPSLMDVYSEPDDKRSQRTQCE